MTRSEPVGRRAERVAVLGVVGLEPPRADAEHEAPVARVVDRARHVGVQIGVAPPTFVISLSHPVDLHFSYKRYLENQLRKEFDFAGAPIVLKVRVRKH
jgi:GTP-binding protein